MDLKTHKQRLLDSNPEFRKEYDTYDLAFEVGQMIIEARSRLNTTQKQLAEMIGTKQSGIARVESGNYLPSLSFLNKIAEVLKTKLVVRFGFMSDFLLDSQNTSLEERYVSKNAEGFRPDSDYLSAHSLDSKKQPEFTGYRWHQT